MTVKDYFRYIHGLPAQATVDLDALTSVNQTIIIDYNTQHPIVLEIQEKKRELDFETQKAMKDPQLSKLFSEADLAMQQTIKEATTSR